MRAASARKRASPQPPSSLAPTARSAVSVRGSTFLWLGSARPRLGWPDRQFVAASFDYDALPWERDDEPTRPARDEEDGAKRRRIKAPTLAELTIEDKELCRLRRLGMTLRDRITVPKADKATIVGETVIYIRVLEKTLEKLERLKMERNRALAAQQHGQQQQLVGAGSSSSSRRAPSSARHPAPALPAPAPAPVPASPLWEANLADMVHNFQVQQAAVAAANEALMTAAAAAGAASSAAAAPQLVPAAAVGFQTWCGQNAVVSVANNEAYINLRCPREPGTLSKALLVLHRYKIEVVTTTVSAQDDGFRMYSIHASVFLFASWTMDLQLLATPVSASASFPENLCAEDRFKLAVSEMLQLINL